MKFKDWFEENLGEYKDDISKHGCDAGFPHITYNSDGAEIYDQFSSEIMESLAQCVDEFGSNNIMELVQNFGRADMAGHWFSTGELDDSTKTLLVWYMCENYANGYV